MGGFARFACLLVPVVAVAGCMSVPKTDLAQTPEPQASRLNLVDRHATHPLSGFASLTNMFSCSYGIFYVPYGTFSPSRVDALREHLETTTFTDGKLHTAVLERFDIYWNDQFLLVQSRTLTARSDSFIEKTYADADSTHMGPVMGCKGKNLGEYYMTQVPPYEGAFVVYLDAIVDGKPYDVHVIYPSTGGPPQNLGLKFDAPWKQDLEEAVMVALARLDGQIAGDSAPATGTAPAPGSASSPTRPSAAPASPGPSSRRRRGSPLR